MIVEITLQDQALSDVLKRVNHALATPEPLLLSFGESLHRVNHDRHMQGLSPDGTPWQPLKSSTLREKRKGGILYKTGEMINALNYQVHADTLKLGFDGDRNAHLAFWQHHGTDAYTIKPKTKKALKFGNVIVKKVNHPGLPARPLLGIPKSDINLLKHVAEDYLNQIIK